METATRQFPEAHRTRGRKLITANPGVMGSAACMDCGKLPKFHDSDLCWRCSRDMKVRIIRHQPRKPRPKTLAVLMAEARAKAGRPAPAGPPAPLGMRRHGPLSLWKAAVDNAVTTYTGGVIYNSLRHSVAPPEEAYALPLAA